MKNFPEDALVSDWIPSYIQVPHGSGNIILSGAEDGGNRRGEIGDFKEERGRII